MAFRPADAQVGLVSSLGTTSAAAIPALLPANRMTQVMPPTIAKCRVKCRVTARPPLFLSGAHRLSGDSVFDQRIGASLGSARPGIVPAWRAGLHCIRFRSQAAKVPPKAKFHQTEESI